VAIAAACAGPDPRAAEPQDAAGQDAGWLARAQEQIAAGEYRASENGEGLQAPNRAHNLRTYFEPVGIRVHDRTAGGQPQLVELRLNGVGRGRSIGPVAPGEVIHHEGRVEIHRPGLVEWYVNSAAGLEQGFTLAERPEGDGPLVVELAVAGAQPVLQGDAIVFATGGRKLRYGQLVANDRAGGELSARFDLASADRLRIVVDDARATYPVVIDPLLTETADTQLESNQADTQLGASVAGAGDVNGDGYADVIVGAPGYDAGQNNEGAAFVFHGSASGIATGNPATAATQLESDQASSSLPGEVIFAPGFGFSVAGAGDVNGDGYADVIVGAYGYNGDQLDEGAAFIFHGSGSGIADGDPSTAASRLESNTSGPFLGLPPRFGYSVAGAGDVNGDGYADVIVGSNDYSDGQNREGAAFVFHGSSSGVAHGNPATAAAQLESNVADSEFGWSVAPAGDVNADGYADVIVGDPYFGNGQGNEGGAFVFHGSASGIADGSPETAPAQLESNEAGAQLGFGVAGGGDVNGDGYSDVIAGAPTYGGTDAGAAFVFLGSSSGVADGNPVTANGQFDSNQASAMLGERVAMAGDVNGDGYGDVIVGARLYDAGHNDEGAAFVFRGSASGAGDGNPSTAAAQLETNQADAWMWTVASAGDVNGDGYADVIAGAHLYDNGQSNEGAAFVYLGGSSGIADGDPTTAIAQLESDQPSSLFGYSTAGAGDVNGDGYGDVIVGAYQYDAGQTDEGAAFVFLGSASGIADGNPATAQTQLESDQTGAYFGERVAGAGDVNGDGYGDVIVGAAGYDNGQTDEGGAFVFHGSATGIANGNPATAATRLESNLVDTQLIYVYVGFGVVAAAGDVNGDGYGDVIVGAPGYDNGQTDEGAAFMFHGSPTGIADGNPTTAAAQLEVDQQAAGFGYVASAGDVNGDGYGDVIVGAFNYNLPPPSVNGEGASFVFHGSASGIGVASTVLTEGQTGSYFGWSVSSAGDVNGDGYGDVIIGAPRYTAGEANEGGAFVYRGSASGILVGSSQLESNQAAAFFGAFVASAGDVNGDGYADVIVGAPDYDAGQTDEGAAFVFPGSASGIADGDPATAAAQLESNQAATDFGNSVAGAGDVNGDGFPDVIVGASNYGAGQSNEGAAFVYLGNSSGRPVLARQRRGNGSGIAVQPWGGAYSGTGFAAELRANHPQGAGRVKAELQACPAGPPAVAFGDASCTTLVSPSWLAVNGATPEVLISETFSGLTNNTLYRWRARVLHAPATGTIPTEPAHGPWRRLGAQSVEADIRLPEPGLVLSLISGLALAASLARRRR
jgi:hypothetical protein